MCWCFMLQPYLSPPLSQVLNVTALCLQKGLEHQDNLGEGGEEKALEQFLLPVRLDIGKRRATMKSTRWKNVYSLLPFILKWMAEAKTMLPSPQPFTMFTLHKASFWLAMVCINLLLTYLQYTDFFTVPISMVSKSLFTLLYSHFLPTLFFSSLGKMTGEFLSKTVTFPPACLPFSLLLSFHSLACCNLQFIPHNVLCSELFLSFHRQLLD